MNPEIEVLELLKASCAAIRISKKRPDLWEAAARKERELMEEIKRAKAHAEPLLHTVPEVAGARG
jgi:hypothetical protein